MSDKKNIEWLLKKREEFRQNRPDLKLMDSGLQAYEEKNGKIKEAQDRRDLIDMKHEVIQQKGHNDPKGLAKLLQKAYRRQS